MSFVKKQNIDKTSNASKNISRKLPSLDIQNKIEENIKNVQSTKLSKEKDMLKKQLKLIENKQVRAVPGT
jgi:restriction endonuclease S subunit